MQIFRSLDQLPEHFKRGAVSIGNFDGVHRGHAKLIERLCEQATQVDGPTLVFTFDPHPVRILRPDQAPPPLTWTERKAELLGALGVDALIAYPATQELLNLTHEQFFARFVVDALNTRVVVEGPNFLFGRDRLGNTTELAKLCRANQIDLEIVEPTEASGTMVSSSRVRDAIREGRIDSASQILTCPYRLRGMVTHGVGRGAQIGFPTANLEAVDTLIPGAGVYAGHGFVAGERFTAAIHIGTNPTFSDDQSKLEVHLLHFDRAIYGQPLEVEFHARIRDVRKFQSPTELTDQIRSDLKAVQAWSDRPKP